MEKRGIKDREEGKELGRNEKANVGGRVKSGRMTEDEIKRKVK